jgi:oligoendopeptidase F
MEKNSGSLSWDTSLLYQTGDAQELAQELSLATTRTASFRESYRGRVATLNPGQMLAALLEYEAVVEQIVKPQMYAHLLFAADSEDDFSKKLSQQTTEFGNLMSRELLFFDLEIIQMNEEQFLLLVGDQQLAGYRHYLENLRKFHPHTLSEREESLLKQKSLIGTEAFSRLFDEVCASFRYTFTLEGETREFSGEELLGLLHHPNADVREKAFGTFLKRHEEEGVVFAAIFNNIALDHAQDLELRHYTTPMEPTNLGNELPQEVVARMMSVSEANYHLAQDYFRLKAQLLNLDKLKNTDIYAPVAEADRKYSFSEAQKLVLDAYGSFSPEFRTMAETFFSGKRIDVFPRHGKSGGAFCMGITPALPPYLLLNFTGNLRDVATIAHELGHGIHYLLSRQQTMLNYHAPLPLAETASVFGEMLLTRNLLKDESDRQVKISLLCAKIEDIIATTFRQNVLTRFEERLHLERKDGLLTADHICDLWWEENSRLFGDTVEMIEPYRWGWSYISHFIHTRFYCYSYTFAELIVLSLYQSYQNEGDSFIPVYREILASGGSRSPADTVRAGGIDLTDPGFWQKGYDVLHELIGELKRLV